MAGSERRIGGGAHGDPDDPRAGQRDDAEEDDVKRDAAAEPARDAAVLKAYLARVEGELATAPEADRREILLETQSHVAEQLRRSPTRPIDDVLAELGPPDVYARHFLRDGAVPQITASRWARALGRLADGRWTSRPLLFLVVAAYAVAVLALVLAVSKVLAPDSLGLWIAEVPGRSRPRFFFGVTDQAQEGREVLGYWIILPLLLIAVSIHLGIARFLKRALRDDIS
jgi:hypothetical protein